MDERGPDQLEVPRVVESADTLKAKEELLKVARTMPEIYEWAGKADWREFLTSSADFIIPAGLGDLVAHAILAKYWLSYAKQAGLDKNRLARIFGIQAIDLVGSGGVEMVIQYTAAAVGSVVPVAGTAIAYGLSEIPATAISASFDYTFRANELAALVFAEHLREKMEAFQKTGGDLNSIPEVARAVEAVHALQEKRRGRMMGRMAALPEKLTGFKGF